MAANGPWQLSSRENIFLDGLCGLRVNTGKRVLFGECWYGFLILPIGLEMAAATVSSTHAHPPATRLRRQFYFAWLIDQVQSRDIRLGSRTFL